MMISTFKKITAAEGNKTILHIHNKRNNNDYTENCDHTGKSK